MLSLSLQINCVRSLRGRRDSAKNDPEVGKNDLTNSGNLLEPL